MEESVFENTRDMQVCGNDREITLMSHRVMGKSRGGYTEVRTDNRMVSCRGTKK